MSAPIPSAPTLLLCSIVLSCASAPAAAQENGPSEPQEVTAGKPVETLPGEVRLRNMRQLTFGGQNAEAYFSNDGTRLILQSKRPPFDCDQIFTIDLRTGEEELVSTGKGRTTCAFFMQGDEGILYSSTHLADEDCPPPVMFVKGEYVWPIHSGYDIFTADPDGSDLRRLTTSDAYDAEATVCPVTGEIVFTSTRDGDLELYIMAPDGSAVRRLTERPGYDGGAFFSHDGTKIVQRSHIMETEEESEKYFSLLEQGLVMPSEMEITVLRRDGTGFRQVTDNGKANFAPYWHPDDERILFASNMDDPKGRNFELYMIHEDGTGLEQITFNGSFDGFPMFSPDGRHLVFASNRYGKERGETNVFIAEWVEDPADN